MKKSILFAVLFSLLIAGKLSVKADVMKFSDALNMSSKKPMLMIIYAPWTNNSYYLPQFKKLQGELGDVYNYVELDIANSETKVFNERYHIYPKLPYILMLRDNGKVSRYVHRECLSDYACLLEKTRYYLQQ